MTENKLSSAKIKILFRHSDISSARARRLRAPYQSLSFTQYKDNRDDGETVELFEFINKSQNKTSSLISEEKRYKKKYYASCSKTCARAIANYPTRFGGTYTTPQELKNNCNRVFRGRSIGIRRCEVVEVVSPTVINERIAEVSATDTAGQTCEDVKSTTIETTSGGTNANIIFSEDFEYKTDA